MAVPFSGLLLASPWGEGRTQIKIPTLSWRFEKVGISFGDFAVLTKRLLLILVWESVGA